MTIGRREASLVTSAMLGSAIVDMCTVTWYQGSRGRSGRDNGENKGRAEGNRGRRGRGIMSYKERYRSTVVEAERYHHVK